MQQPLAHLFFLTVLEQLQTKESTANFLILSALKIDEVRTSNFVVSIGSHFTGLDYWTGLLDWTTGLTQNGVKCLFQPFFGVG